MPYVNLREYDFIILMCSCVFKYFKNYFIIKFFILFIKVSKIENLSWILIYYEKYKI